MKLLIARMGATVLAVLAVACGSDDSMGTQPVGGSGGSLGGEEDVSCPAETPPFDFGPTGLSATNEAMGIKAFLESASSRPPYFGYNDWTVAFTDLAGNPLPDAQLTWACAFMPLHGHGTNPKGVNKLGGGRYELLQQNMAMQGGWQIRLWVDPTGAGELFEGGGSVLNRNACSEPSSVETLSLAACVPRKRAGS